MICSRCDDKIRKEVATYGDRGTPFEAKPLCMPCYSGGNQGAAVFYGPSDDGLVITATQNATVGDFRLKWHAVSPMGGYYEVESDGYEKLSSSHLIAGHESLVMVKGLNDRIKAAFEKEDLRYARAVTMSANPNVNDYHVFVENGQALLGKDIVKAAKEAVGYDNPKWHRNILFSEDQFNLLAELFPERGIRTDYDAAKIMDEYGGDVVFEIERRVRSKPPTVVGGPYIV